MIDRVKRWLGATAWDLLGRATRNRHELYGGAAGLRILTFHMNGPRDQESLRRVVSWCLDHVEIATPADADAVLRGAWPHGDRDRLLITFDDGLEGNYEAARWLASVGVAATFFIVPSLVGRTLGQFVAHHAARGVEAYPPIPSPEARGLSVTEVREMIAMGHRIGAHNFAHRDLGRLHAPPDLDYEIDRALEAVSELTGEPCDDFAFGFGQPHNVSDAAAALLLARCERVYACHRGLNVPGRTPRFLLRDAVEPFHPFAFTRACIRGCCDHHVVDRARLMASRVGLLPDRAAPSPRARATSGVR